MNGTSATDATRASKGVNRPDVRPALFSVGELFGGVERQLIDLCIYIRRRQGAYPPLLLFHDLELACQARAMGIEPVILSARHRYDPSLVRQLARALAAFDTNVVHAHGYKATIASALATWPRRPPFRVVKTEHGRPEPAGRHWLRWTRSRLNHLVGLLATRRATAVVAYVTEDIARHYARVHRGLRRVVIPNGIDPLDRRAFPRPPELEPGKINLGVVGRVTAVKGIGVALRALASPAMPASARLHVIGTGPLLEPLQREAATLGVHDKVEFLGFRRNVLDFVAHLDGLLMPSFHEGLPYTVLEAMSLGVPIVASRVGGLAEVLRDGETALLVPPGEVAALEKAVARIATDRHLGRSLGDSAARVQRGEYTLDLMGERYWRVYEGCLACQEVAVR